MDVGFPEIPSELTRKVAKAVGEFEAYIRNNEEFIPNFGERRRNGERSTAFVESTVNRVVSKRMVKKQQMQWTPRGAHLLLQIRTRVLNNELEDVFRRWYPQFRAASASAPAFQRSHLLVLQRQRGEPTGKGEVDMDVGRGQEFSTARLQPTIAGVGLTLGTVPIPEGNGEISVTCMGSTSLWGVR